MNNLCADIGYNSLIKYGEQKTTTQRSSCLQMVWPAVSRQIYYLR